MHNRIKFSKLRYRKIANFLRIFTLPVILLSACNFPTANQELPTGEPSSLQLTLSAMDIATAANETPTLPPEIATPSAPDPFPGVQTATPAPIGAMVVPIPTIGNPPSVYDYVSLSGDTLPALAARFEVEEHEIISGNVLPPTVYIDPGTRIQIPNVLSSYTYPNAYFPDSEVVYSPSALEVDINQQVSEAGGYLSGYTEVVEEELYTGAEIVLLVARERSINPRLLLAFLELRSKWVLGKPENPGDVRHPIGFFAPGYTGLYEELSLAANHLNIGYYNWRVGELNRLRYEDGETVRLNPSLNAGTAAIFNLFAKFYERDDFERVLFGDNNFKILYQSLFPDPWQTAAGYEPLLYSGLTQPALELPFSPGEEWSFTGGPHRVLTLGSPLGALDFSPVTGQANCAVSKAWITAPASGLVTRTSEGVLVLDLDKDGHEGTGWVLYFLHIAAQDRLTMGTLVEMDTRLGHPSCEGGNATGSHVHIARKYNGEWLAADGPLSFDLGGWRAVAGERIYEGSLVKDNQAVFANPGGSQTSIIER